MKQLQAKPAKLIEQSLFSSDLVKGFKCMPVQELSFLFLGHFAQWSKKKERMLIVNRPSEVLNFEQKQLLAMVVFFIFML